MSPGAACRDAVLEPRMWTLKGRGSNTGARRMVRDALFACLRVAVSHVETYHEGKKRHQVEETREPNTSGISWLRGLLPVYYDLVPGFH